MSSMWHKWFGMSGLRLPKKPIRVLGIDLGTTNSTTSEIVFDPCQPDEILVRTLNLEQETLQGIYTHTLVPSVVAIHDKKVFIGEGAKRLRADRKFDKDRNIFYECKNDIGNKRTYHRAPEGYRSAAEIGGKVLTFLRDAALSEDSRPIERLVVTVPASYQAAQRFDTVQAAKLAEINLESGALLDEPVAAFLDYLFTKGQELTDQLSKPQHLVVFDFGGGTCDVAVFRIEKTSNGPLQVAALGVSRYHRLGGGDIDAAVVHEVLVPQLREQNGLSQFDLTFRDKKKVIEPALLSIAEQLKIGLCDEIRRLQAFGTYDSADKSSVIKSVPGSYFITLGEREFELKSPRLNAAQLERLLEPFLNTDFLYARETEYRMTCSIFSPLRDAIDRTGLTTQQVDLCLAVGGSSLIPSVMEALDEFFHNARVLTYQDSESVKTCVSRGAAWHAIALALYGQGLVQQVCHDGIALRTESGIRSLIPQGAKLPFPADGTFAKCTALGAPDSASEGESCVLRLDLLAETDERFLYYSRVWKIEGPIRKGAALSLEYRMDENLVLDLKMTRADGGDGRPFTDSIDKPFTNVVNPQFKLVRALEIEEELKTGGNSLTQKVEQMTELASIYAEVGQSEKAIEILKTVMQRKAEPDVALLNRIAFWYSNIGDDERAEKFYIEGGRVSDWTGTWFNLAMLLRRRGRLQEAIQSVERAIAGGEEGPFLVLRAQLADDQHELSARDEFLERAMTIFGPPQVLSDWELGWLHTGTQMLGNEKQLAEIDDLIRQRHKEGNAPPAESGKPPLVIVDKEETT